MPGKISILLLILALVIPAVLFVIRRSGFHSLDEQGFLIPATMVIFSLLAIRTEFQNRAGGHELILFEPLDLQGYLFGHVIVLGIIGSIVIALYQNYDITRRFRILIYALTLLIFFVAFIEVFLLIPSLTRHRSITI